MVQSFGPGDVPLGLVEIVRSLGRGDPQLCLCGALRTFAREQAGRGVSRQVRGAGRALRAGPGDAFEAERLRHELPARVQGRESRRLVLLQRTRVRYYGRLPDSTEARVHRSDCREHEL